MDSADLNPPVIVADDDAVRTIRLNRPDQLNSLTVEVKTLLRDSLAAAAVDPDVRSVVITGSGRAFCAGQDLHELLELSGPDTIEATIADFYAPIVREIVSMPKPVVAAINGTVVGAGLSIALACDIRIAAASARFATGFAGIGFSCDTGMSWTLPRLIGRGAALELLLRPRPVAADEALALGLVGEVADDDGFATRVAEAATQLAAGPTLAFASMKASVHYAETSTLDEALAFETTRMVATGASEDHRAAVEAFLAKRPARFAGR